MKTESVRIESLVEVGSESQYPKLKVHYASAYAKTNKTYARVLGIPSGMIGQPRWWNLFLWMFPLTDFSVQYSSEPKVMRVYTRKFLGKNWVTSFHWDV